MLVKKGLKGLAIVAVALAVYVLLTILLNKKAYDTRGRIVLEFSDSLRADAVPALPSIGGVAWDYICTGSYEARGIDVASAVWIARRALVRHIGGEELDFSGFDIADETYTEFSGSRHGLVFISLREKIVVGTKFPSDVGLYGLSCVEAAGAVLTDVPKGKYPNLSAMYNRYFVLSGAKPEKRRKK